MARLTRNTAPISQARRLRATSRRVMRAMGRMLMSSSEEMARGALGPGLRPDAMAPKRKFTSGPMQATGQLPR